MPESGETQPICGMRLGGRRVDFMPDDEEVLGFTNRWYKGAMETAMSHALTHEITIQVVAPVFFLATKLEAYKGRGDNDVLGSRDIEDILHLVDGRAELISESQAAEQSIQAYIAEEISRLLEDDSFEYAVASQARGNTDRESLICRSLDLI